MKMKKKMMTKRKKTKKDNAATLAPAVLQQKRRVLEAAPALNNALVNKKGNRLEHDKVVHAPFPLAGTFLQYSHKPLRVLPPPSTKTKREYPSLRSLSLPISRPPTRRSRAKKSRDFIGGAFFFIP